MRYADDSRGSARWRRLLNSGIHGDLRRKTFRINELSLSRSLIINNKVSLFPIVCFAAQNTTTPITVAAVTKLKPVSALPGIT
jgi:hypothetical protein